MAVAYSYNYLFSPVFNHSRNPYDPNYRGACELYNTSLEGALRILQQRGNLP